MSMGHLYQFNLAPPPPAPAIGVAVYALWKVPELLPAFTLKGGEVSQFVIGGADLMFPGINVPPEGLPSFVAGEPWAVKVPENPAPIAVNSLHGLFLFSTTVRSFDHVLVSWHS